MKARTACSCLLSLCRSLTSLESQGGSPEEKTSSWHLSVPIQSRDGVSTLSGPGKVQVQGNRNSHHSGVNEPEAGVCLLHHDLRGEGLALGSQSRAMTGEMLITSVLITVSFSQSSQFSLKTKGEQSSPQSHLQKTETKGKEDGLLKFTERWLRESGLAGRQALPSRLLLMIASPFPRSTINPDS